MIIGIVRYPQFAAKARGLEALLGPLLPLTRQWLQHITMHEVCCSMQSAGNKGVNAG